MSRLAAITIAGAAALLLSMNDVRVLADTLYPATVTFSDRGDDKITSDYSTTGNHSYVNGGADKLECGFHTVTNDLVMRARTGPSPRYLTFIFSPIAPAGAPTGSLQEHNLFMNIRDILTLPRGTAKNTLAIFNTAVGNFYFDPAWVDSTTYATQVFVSRSANTWTVTADPGVPPGPGDVAGLTKAKGNKTLLLGIYHMPFQISVDCPSCP
jgi:hypothetical protein